MFRYTELFQVNVIRVRTSEKLRRETEQYERQRQQQKVGQFHLWMIECATVDLVRLRKEAFCTTHIRTSMVVARRIVLPACEPVTQYYSFGFSIFLVLFVFGAVRWQIGLEFIYLLTLQREYSIFIAESLVFKRGN